MADDTHRRKARTSPPPVPHLTSAAEAARARRAQVCSALPNARSSHGRFAQVEEEEAEQAAEVRDILDDDEVVDDAGDRSALRLFAHPMQRHCVLLLSLM